MRNATLDQKPPWEQADLGPEQTRSPRRLSSFPRVGRKPRLLTMSLRLTEPGKDGFFSWEKRLRDQKRSGSLRQALPAPVIVTGREGHPQNGWEEAVP